MNPDGIDRLIKDFYAKYEPNKYSDEQVKKVKDYYKGNYNALVKDFYAKYEPDKYSDEQVNKIVDYYGLKKKEDSQTGATSQTSSTQSIKSQPQKSQLIYPDQTNVKNSQKVYEGKGSVVKQKEADLANMADELTKLNTKAQDLKVKIDQYDKGLGGEYLKTQNGIDAYNQMINDYNLTLKTLGEYQDNYKKEYENYKSIYDDYANSFKQYQQEVNIYNSKLKDEDNANFGAHYPTMEEWDKLSETDKKGVQIASQKMFERYYPISGGIRITPLNAETLPLAIEEQKENINRAKETYNTIDSKIAELEKVDKELRKGETFMPQAFFSSKTLDKDVLAVESTIDFLNAAKKYYEQGFNEDTKNAFWKGLTSLPIQDLISGGITEMITNMHLASVAMKAQDNPESLTEYEENLLAAYTILQEAQSMARDNSGRAYRVGQDLEAMIPFLVDLAATRGMGAGAKKVTKETMEAVIKRMTFKTLDRRTRYILANRAGSLLGESVASVAQAGISPITGGNIAKRMVGQFQIEPSEEGEYKVKYIEGTAQKPFEAILKGWGDVSLEYFSEGLGEYGNIALKTYVKNPLTKTLVGQKFQTFSDAFAKTKVGAIMNNPIYKSVKSRIRYDDLPMELAEEVFTGVVKPILLQEGTVGEFFDKENLIETSLTILAMAGGMTGTQLVTGSLNYIDVSKQASENEAYNKLDSGLKTEINNIMMLDSPSAVKDALGKFLIKNENDLDEKSLKPLISYVFRGVRDKVRANTEAIKDNKSVYQIGNKFFTDKQLFLNEVEKYKNKPDTAPVIYSDDKYTMNKVNLILNGEPLVKGMPEEPAPTPEPVSTPEPTPAETEKAPEVEYTGIAKEYIDKETERLQESINDKEMVDLKEIYTGQLNDLNTNPVDYLDVKIGEIDSNLSYMDKNDKAGINSLEKERENLVNIRDEFVKQLKEQEDAREVRKDEGQLQEEGNVPKGSQNKGSQDLQRNEKEERTEVEQQTQGEVETSDKLKSKIQSIKSYEDLRDVMLEISGEEDYDKATLNYESVMQEDRAFLGTITDRSGNEPEIRKKVIQYAIKKGIITSEQPIIKTTETEKTTHKKTQQKPKTEKKPVTTNKGVSPETEEKGGETPIVAKGDVKVGNIFVSENSFYQVVESQDDGFKILKESKKTGDVKEVIMPEEDIIKLSTDGKIKRGSIKDIENNRQEIETVKKEKKRLEEVERLNLENKQKQEQIIKERGLKPTTEKVEEEQKEFKSGETVYVKVYETDKSKAPSLVKAKVVKMNKSGANRIVEVEYEKDGVTVKKSFISSLVYRDKGGKPEFESKVIEALKRLRKMGERGKTIISSALDRTGKNPITDEEINNLAVVIDAQAEAWSSITGRPKVEYYENFMESILHPEVNPNEVKKAKEKLNSVKKIFVFSKPKEGKTTNVQDILHDFAANVALDAYRQMAKAESSLVKHYYELLKLAGLKESLDTELTDKARKIIADEFVKYMTSGETSVPKIKPALKAIKQYLAKVWNKIKGVIKIDEEVVTSFDKMFEMADVKWREKLTEKEKKKAEKYSLNPDDFASKEQFKSAIEGLDKLEKEQKSWESGLTKADMELANKYDINVDEYETEKEFRDAIHDAQLLSEEPKGMPQWFTNSSKKKQVDAMGRASEANLKIEDFDTIEEFNDAYLEFKSEIFKAKASKAAMKVAKSTKSTFFLTGEETGVDPVKDAINSIADAVKAYFEYKAAELKITVDEYIEKIKGDFDKFFNEYTTIGYFKLKSKLKEEGQPETTVESEEKWKYSPANRTFVRAAFDIATENRDMEDVLEDFDETDLEDVAVEALSSYKIIPQLKELRRKISEHIKFIKNKKSKEAKALESYTRKTVKEKYAEKAKEVLTVKATAIDYVKALLKDNKINDYYKKQFNQILTVLKKVKSLEKLQDTLDELDSIVATMVQRKEISQLNKAKKRIKKRLKSEPYKFTGITAFAEVLANLNPIHVYSAYANGSISDAQFNFYVSNIYEFANAKEIKPKAASVKDLAEGVYEIADKIGQHYEEKTKDWLRNKYNTYLTIKDTLEQSGVKPEELAQKIKDELAVVYDLEDASKLYDKLVEKEIENENELNAKKESLLQDDDKIVRAVERIKKKFKTKSEQDDGLKKKYGVDDEELDYMYEVYDTLKSDMADYVESKISVLEDTYEFHFADKALQDDLNTIKTITSEELKELSMDTLVEFSVMLDKIKMGIFSGSLNRNILIPIISKRNARELGKSFTKKAIERLRIATKIKGIYGDSENKDLVRKVLDNIRIYRIDDVLGIPNLFKYTLAGISKADAKSSMSKKIIHELEGFVDKAYSERKDKIQKDPELEKAITVKKEVRFPIGSKELKAQVRGVSSTILGLYLRAREAQAMGVEGSVDKDGNTINIVRNRLDKLKQNMLTNSNTSNRISGYDVKLMEGLYEYLPKNEDGTLDVDRIYDKVLTPSEKSYVDYYDSTVSPDILNKARYIQEIFRGGIFKAIPSYYHAMSEMEYNLASDLTNESIRNARPFDSTISVRSSSTYQRVSRDAAEFFDAYSSIKRSVIDTYHDYYFTPEIVKSLKTINALKENYGIDTLEHAFLAQLDEAVVDIVKAKLISKKLNTDGFNKFMRAANKHIVSSALGVFYRPVAELPSNMAISVMYPTELAEGASEYGSYEGYKNLMIDVGSVHVNALGLYSEDRTAMERETSYATKKSFPTTGEKFIDSMLENRMAKFKFWASDTVIKAADNVLRKPLWIGSFRMEFKNTTGTEFNLSEYYNNPEYSRKYANEIENARIEADKKTSIAFTSPSEFEAAVKIARMSPEQRDKFWIRANMFLTTFNKNDFTTAAVAIKQALFDGKYMDAVRAISALSIRQTSYMLIMTTLGRLVGLGISSAFGGGDDDWEKFKQRYSSKEAWIRSAIAGVTSLLAGGLFNYARTVLQLVLEAINMNITDNLLVGKKYNPMTDNLTYNVISIDNLKTEIGNTGKFIKIVGGGIGSYLATAFNSITGLIDATKSKQDPVLKLKDAINLGLLFSDVLVGLPLYRNLNAFFMSMIDAQATTAVNAIHNDVPIDKFIAEKKKILGAIYDKQAETKDRKEYAYIKEYRYDDNALFLIKGKDNKEKVDWLVKQYELLKRRYPDDYKKRYREEFSKYGNSSRMIRMYRVEPALSADVDDKQKKITGISLRK